MVDCGRKSSQFCSVCPYSVCAKHAEGVEFQAHKELGSVCPLHSPEDFEFFVDHRAEEEALKNKNPKPSTSKEK